MAAYPTVVIAAGIFPRPQPDRRALRERLHHRVRRPLDGAEAIAAGTVRADAVVVATQRLDLDRLAALANSVRVIGRQASGWSASD